MHGLDFAVVYGGVGNGNAGPGLDYRVMLCTEWHGGVRSGFGKEFSVRRGPVKRGLEYEVQLGEERLGWMRFGSGFSARLCGVWHCIARHG